MFLVEGGASATSLNLRLPLGSGELPALERWVSAQLAPSRGPINWQSLPPQLQELRHQLRQGLISHQQAGASQPSSAVTLGLGGLLRQPEFQRSESLRPAAGAGGK